MPVVTSAVLCPSCGTKNRPGFNLATPCTNCGKALPTIVPRAMVYALRTLTLPILFLVFLVIVLYGSPMLKGYRDHINHMNDLSAAQR